MASPSHRLALIAAFVVAISLPLPGTFLSLLHPDRDVRGEAMAPTPELGTTLASWKRFPGDFAWYFEQRFAFKELMAYLNGRVLVSWLGTSPTRSVVLGRDGWLFLGSERVPEQYRQAHAFTPVELEAFADALATRQRWLAEQGIPYLVVLCPNAQSIHPEGLPEVLRPKPDVETRTDQLVRNLSEHSDVDVLDLRPALRTFASRVRLFHKTDTHWNPFGAYVGSIAIMERLKQSLFPQLQLPRIDPTKQRRRWASPGDLARKIALRRDYREEIIEPAGVPLDVEFAQGGPFKGVELDWPYPGELHELRGTRPQLGRALVFSDSFGLATMPYLGAFFERAVFESTYDLNRDRVAKERPDVVIQLLVERKLMTLRLAGFKELRP